MATYTWDSFIGGESQSSKRGYKYSYQDGLGLRNRADADKLTALRRLDKESSTTVVDLIKWFKEYDGYVFGYGDTGKLYRRSTSNVWSVQRSVSGSAGQGLEVFNTLNSDALWYALTSSLGRATTLTGTMVFDDDYISTENLNRILSNIPSALAGTPYSLTTSINEGATHRQTVTPTKRMCRGFQVYVTAKGTSADWTLTLHDTDNNSIGTATVTNANLTNSTYNNFYFSSPVELIPGVAYHYHLTATNTTGTPTAGTGTNNDLEDGAYYLICPSLVSDSYYHPLLDFNGILCAGNGRFLATLDDSEVYDPERLTFSKGERVRLLQVVGDFIAIFTWKYNDITKVKESNMYLWDGVSAFVNNIIPIKAGQVNAAVTYGNVLYLITGTQGQISVWTGQVEPIRPLKDVGDNKTVEVYPGAICVWDSLIHFGLSGGTSTSCPRVVYTYGTQNKDYPMSLCKAYPTSADIVDNVEKKTNNSIQIGACLGIDAGTFLVSWKNGSTYGVDNINSTKDQNIVFMTTLRYDGDKAHILKHIKKVHITHSALNTEDSITIEYRLNNDGNNWVECLVSDGDKNKSQGSNLFVPEVDIRFNEIEFRSTIAGQDNLPDLYSITLEYWEDEEIIEEPTLLTGL